MENGPPRSPATSSERRYLTILFVDLVGYTALSELLDPEDLRVLQRRYQSLALRVMETLGGFVARFTGDDILVYFGYPVAHENDAERAVRAALEFLHQLRKLDTSLPETSLPPLTARIGIHTGLVLIAPEIVSRGPTEHSVFGEVVNLAKRIQTEAPEGAVVVSKDTLDLVHGQFDYASLGTRPIRGLSREVELFHVRRPLPGARRATPRQQRSATRMVGRDSAMARIAERWRIARQERRVQMVEVVGEAGVGKTRLLLEAAGQPDLAGALIVQVNCHELFASTALYAVGSYLWGRAGLSVEDDEHARMRKVATFLDEFGMDDAANREVVASLLGLAVSGAVDAAAPTSAVLKRRQYALVTALLRRAGRQQPTILTIEDAHWLDPSSAELLPDILDAARDLPFLLLVTRRSFPRGPALPEPDETILLEHLDGRTCFELARSVPGAEALSDATIARAVAAAEGVPLFLEQLVISLVEEGEDGAHAARKPSGMPLRLAEMMSERLDRRPGGRRIVQAAACIGRSFTPDFLAAMLEQDAAAVVRPLDSLVDAELLLPRPYGAETRYEFRHALLQRLAYESVVQADRRAMHERIVAVMDSREQTDPIPPEVRAHHLTEAARFEAAVGAWLQAGVAAAGRSAHIEAIEHLRRGLSLLPRLPEAAPSRRTLELNLQAALMASTLTTEGATSSRVSECCQRGLELCRTGEPSPLVLSFAYGQFTQANCKGQVEESASLGRLFLSMAEQYGSNPGRAMGHLMLGRVLFGEARLPEALEQYNLALGLCSPDAEGTTTQMFGLHIDVHVKAGLSVALACLGEVDRAIEFGLDAMRTADRLRHPHSTAIPLAYVGGTTFWLLGAADHAVRSSERLIALADEHRLTSFRAIGSGHLGGALCQRGDLAEAVAALEYAIDNLDRIGFLLVMSTYLGRLADAQRRLGRLDEAERNCARAIRLMRASTSLWFEPELRRIEALIAAAREPHAPERAERMLRAAAARARVLGFPIMEMWCLASLRAHLHPRIDPETEARLARLDHLRGAPDRVARAMNAMVAEWDVSKPPA